MDEYGVFDNYGNCVYTGDYGQCLEYIDEYDIFGGWYIDSLEEY